MQFRTPVTLHRPYHRGYCRPPPAPTAGRRTAVSNQRTHDVTTSDGITIGGAVLEYTGYLEAAGRCAPVMLHDIQQATQSQGTTAADPAELGRISTPVLLLNALDTIKPWFTTCVRHVADKAPSQCAGQHFSVTRSVGSPPSRRVVVNL